MGSETITQKVQRLNNLFLEVQAYKKEHPDERLGYYSNSIGSLLNAYREGDLGFDECIELIKEAAATPPSSLRVPEGEQDDHVRYSNQSGGAYANKQAVVASELGKMQAPRVQRVCTLCGHDCVDAHGWCTFFVVDAFCNCKCVFAPSGQPCDMKE